MIVAWGERHDISPPAYSSPCPPADLPSWTIPRRRKGVYASASTG
jgi:hypothetical protein